MNPSVQENPRTLRSIIPASSYMRSVASAVKFVRAEWLVIEYRKSLANPKNTSTTVTACVTVTVTCDAFCDRYRDEAVISISSGDSEGERLLAACLRRSIRDPSTPETVFHPPVAWARNTAAFSELP